MRVFKHLPLKGRGCCARQRLNLARYHMLDAYPPDSTMAVVALTHDVVKICLVDVT